MVNECSKLTDYYLRRYNLLKTINLKIKKNKKNIWAFIMIGEQNKNNMQYLFRHNMIDIK